MKRLRSIWKHRWRSIWIAVALGIFLLLSWSSVFPSASISYSQLESSITHHLVTRATLNPAANAAHVRLSDGHSYSVSYPAGDEFVLARQLLKAHAVVDITVPSTWSRYQGPVTTILIIGAVLMALSLLPPKLTRFIDQKEMGAKRVDVPETRFRDVKGADEAVNELRALVAYLRDPKEFIRAGVRPSRGYLFIGPPGTGKTMLARALAGEAGVPYFAVSCAEFVELYVGRGASRIRGLFKEAHKAVRNGAKIIFLDEVDAIARKRHAGGNQEYEVTLTQLLTEISGFLKNEDVIVIAATNNESVIDPALLRGGRLTRQIYLLEPDAAARGAILKQYAAKLTHLSPDVDFAKAATRALGMAGADLEEVANLAGLLAFDRGPNEPVITRDFENAILKQLHGDARNSAQVNEDDRRATAAHEAGHALVAAVLPGALTPHEVSIIPRARSGGSTFLDGEERMMPTRSQLKAHLVVLLGGRAGESAFLKGDFTAGASDDLDKASSLARKAIFQCGMGSFLTYTDSKDDPHADKTRAAEEVEDWLVEARSQATAILDSLQQQHAALTALLLKQETISGQHLEDLIAQWRFDYSSVTSKQVALS